MKVIGMEHCIRNRMMLTFRFSIKFWHCLPNRLPKLKNYLHAWQILPENLSTLIRKNIRLSTEVERRKYINILMFSAIHVRGWHGMSREPFRRNNEMCE